MVSSTPRPHFTPGKDPVPILQEAGWAPGPVWTGGKSRPHRDSIPDRPARSSVAIPTELPYFFIMNSNTVFPSAHGYSQPNPVHASPLTHTYHVRRSSHSSCDRPINTWQRLQISRGLSVNTLIPRLTSDPANEFFG